MQGVSNASAQELPCFLCALHQTSQYWQFIKLDSCGKRRNYKTQKSLVKTSCKLLPLMLLYHVCPPRQAFLLEKFSLFTSFSGNTFYFMPRYGRRGFSLGKIRPKKRTVRTVLLVYLFKFLYCIFLLPVSNSISSLCQSSEASKNSSHLRFLKIRNGSSVELS